jgi:hypothetical protein
VKGEADPVVFASKWHLAGEGRSEFYELSYWIWFVAKCLNMIMDLSFMNSVTASSLVAKCSIILQDIAKLGKGWVQVMQLRHNSWECWAKCCCREH